MRTVFLLIKALLFLAAVLVAAEFLLFLQESRLDPQEASLRRYLREVSGRIDLQWLRTAPQPDPFSPPLLVFSNKDSGNPERLKTVFESTRMPASKTWVSHDFLQPAGKASTTSYTVTSNSLGFRGKEYAKEKPDGAYRIVALGSYHTFGHGVNDDETYPARLEGILRAKMQRPVEVWNGGRHAATAIVGLARLENEIFEYKPDLLIFEYGFVDPYVFGDNVFPIAMRLPDNPLAIAARTVLVPALRLGGNTRLWDTLSDTFARRAGAKRMQQFDGTVRRMLALAAQHGVPVILIRSLASASPSVYSEDTPGVLFLDLPRALSNDLRYPSAEELASDQYWKGTWLADIPVDASYLQKRFPLYPLQLNRLQWNSRGQEAVAEALAPLIMKKISPHTR